MAESQPSKFPWAGLAIVGTLGTVLQVVILLWHEQDHEHTNYWPAVGVIVVTAVSLGFLWWAAWRYRADAKREKSALMKLENSKADFQAQIAVKEAAIKKLEKVLEEAKSEISYWHGCYQASDARNNEQRHQLEELQGENTKLKTAAVKAQEQPRGAHRRVFEYNGVISGGNCCFEAPLGVCALQVMTIKNAELANPFTAVNVRASIEYLHSSGDRRIATLSSWWHTNPLTSKSPGTTLEPTINLESNEEQKLILSMQDKAGAVFISPVRDAQFQNLASGHWQIIVTIEADNTSPLKLRGGLTVSRNVLESRTILAYDGGFTMVEPEATLNTAA